jgi:hypothetical protein
MSAWRCKKNKEQGASCQIALETSSATAQRFTGRLENNPVFDTLILALADGTRFSSIGHHFPDVAGIEAVDMFYDRLGSRAEIGLVPGLFCSVCHVLRAMQRKPKWHVDVSIGCAIRAAGR